LSAVLVWLGVSWAFSLPLREARRAFDNGRYTDAARLAQARLRNKPGDQEAMLLAARSYAHLELWAEAEAFFAQVPLAELNDYHLRLRGLELRRLRFDAALVCQQIRQRWPDDGYALQHLAALRMLEGRIKEALTLARQLTRIPSYQAAGYMMVAIMEEQLDNPARVIEAVEEALRLSPTLEGLPHKLSDVLEWLAETLLKVGRIEDAQRYAEQARRLNTGAKPLWMLGRARHAIGDYDAARSYWEDALSADKTFHPALRDLGQFFLERGEPGKALAYFEKALELDPDNHTVQQGLEAARHELGQISESGDPLQKTESR
jgi:tetratricopeptide (TPR) repeat protein